MALELGMEKASEMLSGSKLFGQVCLDEIHIVWLASLLLCLMFLFEMNIIAVLEKCWADWEYGYHYAKDYDVTYLLCS
jgi:hypothetical protein